MKHSEEGVMWFHCSILHANVNYFEIRRLQLLPSALLNYDMCRARTAVLSNWLCQSFKEKGDDPEF